MTPETHTDPSEQHAPVRHDTAHEMILLPREETAYKVTHTLQGQRFLHGGTPLPKRQKSEAVTIQ